MKKILLTMLLVVIAMVASRSEYVREAITEGPQPLLEKLNELLGDYHPDKLKQQMADGMKVDTTLANFRRKLDASVKAKEEYLYQFCNPENPQAHPKLDEERQAKMCDYARDKLGIN
ncbi:hypothetical protein DU002_15440 [Corallincola holothuriorum]|uniref:Uncharacterized protein n=1 Tax=Corallincola holothuriorum TaxID=2282215 RepID=A0A368N5N6_9GAMM|nr:hypothetical protein [Corallincola holothuriorum]RCU45450.1 hypothetical protein DU002_15440 [Corallincola holothuriorum]